MLSSAMNLCIRVHEAATELNSLPEFDKIESHEASSVGPWSPSYKVPEKEIRDTAAYEPSTRHDSGM